MLAALSKKPLRDEAAYLGRIPIRNIWLLMLYASDLYRYRPKSKKIETEESPDEIADLVAKILITSITRRLRRNLSLGYQYKEAELGKVRGRVDLLTTERRHSLRRGRICCQFDELTVNTIRNRFVRAALEKISGLVKEGGLARKCRSLANSLKSIGVTGLVPSQAEMSLDNIGQHDLQDREMLAAARLAFDLALPTECIGDKPIINPEREIKWLRKLFERGVAGFYQYTLPGDQWRVRHGKWQDWPVTAYTVKAQALLPRMQTDIVIDSIAVGKRLVIDTKFNSLLTTNQFDDDKLRSPYMYQLYAYLRSQEKFDSLSAEASGCLLHPSVGQTLFESLEIDGHLFHFATVDLSAGTKEIRQQLENIIKLFLAPANLVFDAV